MVKYLQMDGVDDSFLTPILTYTKIEIDAQYEYVDGLIRYIFQSSTLLLRYQSATALFASNLTYSGWNATERCLTIANVNAGVTTNNALRFFARNDGSNNRLKAKVYSVKIYNETSLVAHYDMSTGTVQDQSGNGNHATLTGGTWLDDGTGGIPTGTDGSLSMDTKQSIYSDNFTRHDSKQSIYADASTPFDIRNILYQDGSTSSDTKQVLYQISSTSFDMLQELFNDGQVGSTPFDMRFSLYSDGSILHDSRQAMYESAQTPFDLSQAIYESGEGKGDIHLVLFADSSTHHDLVQSLYKDAAVHFDTKQISFNPDQQKIGTIRLKGKRDLYVYLVAKQELNVPLKAKRELTVSLKGGVNMTMQNQNFSMCAGDTKYLTFSIEGADDLTGATITWGARQRSYSSVENILTKSTGDGITVEGSEVKIKLDPEDTELLNGTYHHECQLEDNLQNVSTVFTGLMTVNKSAV